ncbi:hypothetical protein [Dyadobacter psychrophilus]|uniref:DUF4401 domain-containing protein n=1 Tax=Dyadobacter psychrophilus TaxID=651661 RepID=A0A1T5DLV4_9BACT|nr:hypothetical protein [Dyadobacter psychrophilus]SKB72689.1 hypothetical protein SAMN05660293_01742 [Dyadobacter psychrophilus]
MKKAYNETWIDNLHILNTADHWFEKKLISQEQLENARKAFPQKFYRPGIFVKIGLFIFTLIACSFASGFVSLFLIGNGAGENISIISLICMAGFIFFLELLIKNNGLYHSGVDNALLYAAMGAAVVPFVSLFDNLEVWQYCIILFAVAFTATLRYADMVTAASAFFLLICLLGNLMMKFPIGKAILPFAVMALSAVIYLLVRKDKSTYYERCTKLIEVLSLTTFYLGGNYLIVREGNALLNDLNLPFAPQIPFAPLFYLFTLSIPIVYIFFGLRKKDRILLILGLLAFALSVYTYRHYFSPFTPAQELAIAGMFMIILSAALIKYLHTPKHGISDEQEGKRKLANLEAILVAQHLGQTPVEGNNVEFGGGNFGGGGAGETY